MAKDYSEYQPNEVEKRRLRVHGTKDISFKVFRNTAAFLPDTQTLRIIVDNGFEDIMRLDDMEECERIEKEHREIHEDVLSPEDIQQREELRVDGLAENERDFSVLCAKFKIDRTIFDNWAETEYDAHPELKKRPLNNVLSGATITLRYGEGLLDFIYADFEESFKQAMSAVCGFIGLIEIMAEAEGIDVEEARRVVDSRPEPVEKVYSCVQDIVDEYLRFDDTCMYISEIMYQSLYTAVCPPSFTDDRRARPALNKYYDYIRFLQEDYKALIEFCFDPDFWPEVLGSLHAVERYLLYQRIKGLPASIKRTEWFDFDSHQMGGSEIPYGLSKDELVQRLSGKFQPTPEHARFAEEYGIPLDKLGAYLKFPWFLNVRYGFSSLDELLQLEFSKMLEANMRLKRDPESGQYVLPPPAGDNGAGRVGLTPEK